VDRYFYYAKISRSEEESLPPAPTPARKVLGFAKQTGPKTEPALNTSPSGDEKELHVVRPNTGLSDVSQVTEEEWTQASRAMRTATWGAVFYLITTDILGPYTVPWALSQMGYGSGITLYTVFGALSGYSGWLLWQMFLNLDSKEYPMKTFGDFAFRLYGTVARHVVNVLQSIQLLFNVGIIIISNGQGQSHRQSCSWSNC